MSFDPYKVLGVSKDAPHEDIKKAYKRKVKKVHPDSGGTKEKFHKVQQAYLILSDPDKRRSYDETGSTEDITKDITFELLMSLFSTVLDKDIPTHVNYIDTMREILKSTIANMDDSIESNERDIKRFEKLKTKFTRKKEGTNFFVAVLDDRIRRTVAERNHTKSKRLNTDRALTILDDYDFTPDEKPKTDPLNYERQDIGGFFRMVFEEGRRKK